MCLVNSSTWPTGAAVVQGESDIVYTPGGGSAITSAGIDGELSHSRNTPIDLTNARLDVEIEITSIDGSSGRVSPGLFVNGEGGFAFGGSSSAQTMTATVMFSDLTTTGSQSWPSTTPLGFYITESTSNDRPFTFRVNYVRLSFTQTEFAPTPSLVWDDQSGSPRVTTLEFVSPNGSQTGTITFNDSGQFVFSHEVRAPDLTET